MTADGRPVLGSLFSGYGGLDMGVEHVLGTRTAWVSDIDEGACRILAHRYPDVPNLGDITAIDWAGVEPIDVLTGGFPCQDLSVAGHRRGLRPGTRSGLWEHMAYAIDVLRPKLVVAENVRGLLSADAASDVEPCPWCMGDADSSRPLRALGAVLAELAELGYSATWAGFGADAAGAPHERFRVMLVAWPDDAPDADGIGRGGWPWALSEQARRPQPADGRRDAAADAGHGPESANRRAGLGFPTGLDGGPRPGNEIEQADADRWGPLAAAIVRWERIIGRKAPDAMIPGKKYVSPRFTEWMMGLPEGHVTDVPGLTTAQQLKATGNGVVPQWASLALRYCLAAIARASEPVIA